MTQFFAPLWISILAILLVPSLAHDTSGLYNADSDICHDTASFLAFARECAYPVQQQISFYMVYGSSFFDDYLSDYLDQSEEFYESWNLDSVWWSGSGSGIDLWALDDWFGSWADDASTTVNPEVASRRRRQVDEFDWCVYSGDSWDDWEMDICGTAMDCFEHCMEDATVCDDPDFQEYLPTVIEHYKEQFCHDGTLNSQIEEYGAVLTEDYMNSVGREVGCVDFTVLVSLFLGGTCDVNLDEYNFAGNIVEDQAQIVGAYRQTYNCIRDELTNSNDCEDLEELEELIFYLYSRTISPGIAVSYQEIFNGYDSNSVNPREESRSTVQVFGDPHLRVYGSEESRYQTCAYPGSTVYLRNRYVVVTGVNTAADDGSDGTYMTEVDIKFYNGDGITDENMIAHYIAEDSELPTEFEDSSGNQVTIQEISHGRIRLRGDLGGLSIMLDENWGTYTMVLRMADSVLGASSGLLYAGCTADQQLNRADEIASRRRKRSEDVDCGNSTYAEACQYDYAVTGNATRSMLVVEIMETLVSLTEELDTVLTSSTQSESTGGSSNNESGVDAVHSTPVLMLIGVIFSLLKLYC